MKIRHVHNKEGGTRSVEIRANELSFRALLRRIRNIPGAVITDSSHDPMNDNARVSVRYKDKTLVIDTPFSDYFINCAAPSDAFDEFVALLSDKPVKWWERLF
jgi:hypothetical protein